MDHHRSRQPSDRRRVDLGGGKQEGIDPAVRHKVQVISRKQSCLPHRAWIYMVFTRSKGKKEDEPRLSYASHVMSKASMIRNAAVQTYDNGVTFLSVQLNKATECDKRPINLCNMGK